MKKLYDFIIFEHSGLKNHFVDLCNIGRMLKDSGYTVAIANVTCENEECKNAGFPIIQLQASRANFRNKKLYMKAVIQELAPMTRNFYMGSILSSTQLDWLTYVPRDHKAFLWALRSFFFTEYRRFHISRYYFSGVVRSLYNLIQTRRLTNVCFFVSDLLIRDEFVNLGYNKTRLVIRPERFTKELYAPKDVGGEKLRLLSIGALRKEKRIDFCIKSLDEMNVPERFHFVIAGKAYAIHGYDKMLEQMSANKPYITRISHRLDDEEYDRLVNSCDYLVLSDEKQPSCVTNGTMAEALLSGRPIIAPNYDPYKYIIEKYNVGFLYELGNVKSFKDALESAYNTSIESFAEGLKKYQSDFTYDKVISDFKPQIKEALES